MQDGETLGLERTQSATGEEQYVETSRAGRDDVATSKPQGSVVIESARTKNGKLSFCKNHKIGTWNVRTMNTGKLDIVKREMERTKVEILGISELKWTEMGHFQSDEYKVFFCGQDHVRRNGVAIICDKDTSRCVMGYKPISDRIISIRLDGHPVRTTIIQIYAPTSAASEDDIEDFYGRLQDLIDTVPRGDVLITMGDWNAKIGDKAVEGISGTHGLGDRNEAGERMIEFCEANQLIATNTWFKQPRRRLYTWTSPDGMHRNQIDYILIQKRWRSMIKSAKTMPGADCGTDHELLVATIQVKLKKTKKPEIENRYNLIR